MTFDSDFEKDFRQMRRGMLGSFGMLGVFALLVNLALLAGAVWVVVFVLRQMGVIA